MAYIRPAKISDAKILTDIAIGSEAYWGYDSEYMKKFEEIYKVTEDFLSINTTFIILENNNIIGFYSILNSSNENSLEYFYIAPQHIGKGYGKILCEHMKNYCKEYDIKELFLVTSPQAKEFYEKMGAIFIAEVDSLLKEGRMIPKLKFDFVNKKN